MPTAKIEFTCKVAECGNVISEELEVAPPDYSAERMTDGDSFDSHWVTCPECEKDYEVETVNGMGGLYATVDGHEIDGDIVHEPDFDDWVSFYEPSENAFATFSETRLDLLDLLHGSKNNPDGVLSRMIYSQFIAAMEAYLSDTLLNLTTRYAEIKKRIILNADFLKDQKLNLTDALVDPALAEKRFKTGLQSILYHDLNKVEKLYRIALQADFFPKRQNYQNDLALAISIRHDCVHRNGYRKDGIRHSFDRIKIEHLCHCVTELVSHIEAKVKIATEALWAPLTHSPKTPQGPPDQTSAAPIVPLARAQ
jgi:hypothetical protein